MQRILNVSVSPELGFHILIAEYAVLVDKFLAVDAQQTSVKGNWREEGEGWSAFAGSKARYYGFCAKNGVGEEAHILDWNQLASDVNGIVGLDVMEE